MNKSVYSKRGSMKTETLRRKMGTVFVLLTVLLMTILFIYMVNRYGYSSGTRQQILDRGWQVTINDTRYQDVDLSTFTFPVLGKNDSISLKTTLPSGIKDALTIRLLTYQSVVYVYVDGEKVYEYGQDNADAGQLVGNGYHFINLPEDAGGKELYVILVPTEHNVFTSITPPRLVATDQAYQIFLSENRLSLCIGLFLAVFGLLVTVISTVASLFSEEYNRLVWIGVFSFLIGIWTMCNSKVFQLFSSELSLNTQVEYMTLYLAPTAFCMIILEARKQIAAWRRRVIWVCTGVVFACSCLTFALQLTNTAHYPSTIVWFHGISVVCILVCIAMSLSHIREIRLSEQILYCGTGVLGAFAVADLIRFNVQKYLMNSSDKFTESILPVGTFLFVIMMIVSYIIYLYDKVLSKAQEQSLQRIAYRDSLTGLYNRAKCEELFEQLNAGDEDFALISFDMNGLKSTNDTLGHTEGDLLICSFAKLLRRVFEASGCVIRMGGDEFLVVIRERELVYLDSLMQIYQKHMANSARHYGRKLSAAYGVCRRSDCEQKRAEDLYDHVDKLMYEMKQREKNQRQKWTK